MPEWTPRMQEVCEVICRYALETGEMPTLAEVARRMGLSRTRIWGLWCAIERYERRKHLDPAVHIRRRDMGYLLAVLKDIERAARIAGRVYPWKTKWQGAKQQPEEPKPKPKRPPPNRGPIYTGYRPEEPRPPREPRWEYRPRWVAVRREEPGPIDCPACSGTGVINGEWCSYCGGEATVMR